MDTSHRTKMELTPTLSPHAARRCCQRAVKPENLDLVIRFGHVIRQRGARMVYFLGCRQARRAGRPGLAGTAAVVAPDGVVVTVVRTRSTRKFRRAVK